MAKILIADDDFHIARLIADSLEDEGMECVTVSDGVEVLSELKKHDYDLILLDIMMPNLDGLSVCKKIRDEVKCPILFVTAKGRTIDTVLGLEMGGDDYITKPFIVDELVAKVKAHLRREKRSALSKDSTFSIGDLKIIRDNYEVMKNGELMNLTTREFQLLVFFCDNLGKVMTREQIFDQVWGMDYGDIGSVTVTVKNLRDKIDPENRLIKTVWGVGYKMVQLGEANEHKI
jgi:DNA-binding response OmpR family regulator